MIFQRDDVGHGVASSTGAAENPSDHLLHQHTARRGSGKHCSPGVREVDTFEKHPDAHQDHRLVGFPELTEHTGAGPL